MLTTLTPTSLNPRRRIIAFTLVTQTRSGRVHHLHVKEHAIATVRRRVLKMRCVKKCQVFPW